jgi:quercetin dioxygenase-like cupin family protein
METIIKPELEQLMIGKQLKVLHVSGKSGTHMPEHYATSEAVITVKEGKAILKMEHTNSILRKGDVFLIPSNANHALQIEEDFEGIVTMSIDSIIKFVEK